MVLILLISFKNKRSREANALQQFQEGFNVEHLSNEKRTNADDNESVDKSSLYHEPFNVNMYTSTASGFSLNEVQLNR